MVVRHFSSLKRFFAYKVEGQSAWKVKAIEHYEKLLYLWKDSDPGISEVEDAKEIATGLK
ncbi:hypothetical protein KA005_80425 [bacterium]|nr:hypothetical protein [bacterium]